MDNIINRWLKRPGELFSKFDEGVETVLVFGIIWQAIRFGRMTFSPKPVLSPGHHDNLTIIAYQLSHSNEKFWDAAFNMPVLSVSLILCALCSFFGLMNKNEPMRIIGTIISTGWWFISATMLTIHSPFHDLGGMYFILGLAGVIIYSHRFVIMDRQKDVAFIRFLIGIYYYIDSKKKKRTSDL